MIQESAEIEITPEQSGFDSELSKLPSFEPQEEINIIDPSLRETDKPLKIALLGYRSQPYCGGQGVYLNYLSRALVNMGHEVDVISGEPYPILDERVRLIKIPGLNLFETNHVTALRPHHLKSYSDLFEYFDMLTGGFPEPYTFGRRVNKFLKSHHSGYDIIHDNQSLCLGLLDIQKRIPTMATIHHPIHRDLEIALSKASGWGERALIRRWHSFLLMQNYVVKRLRHVITVSKQSQLDIAKYFNVPYNSVDLVYNGIDTDEFHPIEGRERKSYRLMTTASADVPLKGLDVLLRALANLKTQYPELDLLVVGKAKPGGATEKLINQLGLAKKVQFVSGIETSEMVRLYSEATLAISPSIYEGFGLPAGEAMACGVPLISSDGGALPEIVGDAGVVVPAGDVQSLEKAIGDLLQDPGKRAELGREGRTRILEKFSWAVAAEKMTAYYRQVIQSENQIARRV